MDRLLRTMLAAWAAESADGDSGSRIGADTWSRPHPTVVSSAGGVRASARRAVRFKLGLSLPAHSARTCAVLPRSVPKRRTSPPALIMPAAVNRGMVFLHEDPEKAWAELGRHPLGRRVTYGGWSMAYRCRRCISRASRHSRRSRASGRYRFLTPDELRRRGRGLPGLRGDGRFTRWSAGCRSTRPGNRFSCSRTR